MRYRVLCGELPNGVRFYTQYDSGSSKELAIVCVMAGSLHDPPHRKGLSHLVEHVICAETPSMSRDEVDLLLARITGDPDEHISISTTWTHATYGPSYAVKKHHSRKLFRMFTEMVREPLVRRETLAIERAAVHQEHYLRGEDIVNEQIANVLSEMIFPKGFPARNPIDGSMGDVRKATLKDIKRHLHRYYVPANTFVIYFGPRHEEVRAIVREEMGDWGEGWSKPRNKAPTFSVKRGTGGFSRLKKPKRKRLVVPTLHQHHTAIGFPAATAQSTDALTLEVLARILSGRMYDELRTGNKDWNAGAYRTPVYAIQTFAHGMFAFQFATKDKNFSRRGTRAFRKQCADVCKNLVSREELEAEIGFMYDYLYIDSFQTDQNSLMEAVADSVANGDVYLEGFHARGENLLKLLHRGGRQKIRDAARKYLSGHSASVVIGPG